MITNLPHRASFGSPSQAVCVVRLMGGLGNQMFQYAFGRAISAQREAQVRFDVHTAFRDDEYGRKYDLSTYCAAVDLACKADIPLGLNLPRPYGTFALKMWRTLSSMRVQRRVRFERQAFRYQRFPETECGQYLVGYWQCFRYFENIEEEIRRDFKLVREPTADVLGLGSMLAQIRAISVHVRRYNDRDRNGARIKKAADFHGACSPQYYRRAVGILRGAISRCCYVFTDDVEWAKSELRLPPPVVYVSDVIRTSAIHEMWLMSRCYDHVISNSTFSWWGAWLGKNSDKCVIAPERWIAKDPDAINHICPSSWIKLSD